MELRRARTTRPKRFDRNRADKKKTEFTERSKDRKSSERKPEDRDSKRMSYRNIRKRSSRFEKEPRRFDGKRWEKKEFSSKKSSGKKTKDYYSDGSEKFYSTIKEKLFEILGGKKCTSCGFRDERALGFTNVHDKESFDLVKRSGFVASWGKYISEPELARKEIRILCLNCNAIREPIPKNLERKKPKKSKFFPRRENIRINSEN